MYAIYIKMYDNIGDEFINLQICFKVLSRINEIAFLYWVCFKILVH